LTPDVDAQETRIVVQPSAIARTQIPREAHPFLVFRENQLAFQTVMRLKSRHPRMTSPIVTLIGGRGTGKSHLARQLHREVIEEQTATQILRTSAAEFTGQFQKAARMSQIRDFQRAHRENVDLLIFDDLQELQTRPEVQQQLVAMLDDVLAAGGRVLFTSRRSPGEVRGLNRRLVNRCQGGLLIDLGVAGETSRRKLVEHLATSNQFILPEATAIEIARRGPQSPADLLALVLRLRQSRTTGPISPADLDKYLAAVQAPLSMNEIAKRVARHFGVKLTDLRSANRQASLVTARHVAMYLTRQLAKSQFSAIGEYFGGRNHASVMYACQRVTELRGSDAALGSDLDHLVSQFSA